MNQIILNGYAQVGSFKTLFANNPVAVASKARFATEVGNFLADEVLMEGWIETATTNVNGIAGNKLIAQGKMAHEWDMINGDARPFCRGVDEELFGKVKYNESQILHLADVESYGVCNASYTALKADIGTPGFPVDITLVRLDAAKLKTSAFENFIGKPEVAHKAVETALKNLMTKSIPNMKIHYLNLIDLSKTLVAGFPDFVNELLDLHRQDHTGIHHRGFRVNAKHVDGSFINNQKIEYMNYTTIHGKAPAYTNALGDSPLQMVLRGQWRIKFSGDGLVSQEINPIFDADEVQHFDVVMVAA